MRLLRSHFVWFLLISLFVFFVCPLFAFASQGGTLDFSNPNTFDRLYSAITSHNWQFVAAFVVIGLNSLLIWIDEYTGTNTWLDKGKWKWAFGILLSVLGALGTRLLAKESMAAIDWLAAIGQGAFVGAAAAGIFKGAKEFREDK